MERSGGVSPDGARPAAGYEVRRRFHTGFDGRALGQRAWARFSRVRRFGRRGLARSAEVPADGCLDLLSDGIGAILALLALAGVLVLALLFVVPALLALVELVVVTAFAALVFVVRWSWRRQYRVEVLADAEVVAHRSVVGRRASREVAEAARRGLDAGLSPQAALGDGPPS